MAFVLSILSASLLPSLWASTVLAARPDIETPEHEAASPFAPSIGPWGAPEVSPRLAPTVLPGKPSDLILRAQKALTTLGFYIGPEDGRFSLETEAAVRAYQRRNGMPVNGRIDRRLVEGLENSLQVRVLLRRLDQVRIENISAAREALLSHPATRDLVAEKRDEVADPTRDATACLKNPTVRCLIDEAMESAKAVFKPELRDWALGEILVAQARAGLRTDAMQTASLMRDPRLIVVALRDIAEAQAATGMSDQALTAVEIIPDAEKRADALAAIAEIQARRGDGTEAKATVARLLAAADALPEPMRQISLKARAAVILALTGEAAEARAMLETAEAGARANIEGNARSVALRHVATAFAETRQMTQALKLLDDVANDADRTSVLITTARRQAQAGDAAAALATADTIEAVRFRAVVLGQIALSQAEAGRLADAEATLAVARAAIEKIRLPFARSYAISQVSQSMAGIGRLPVAGPQAETIFRRAADQAAEIDDTRLRAHTLWSIAAEQVRAGDEDGAGRTRAMAEKATGEIKSGLTRVWMFSEIASGHAARGEETSASAAFAKGLGEARAIDNAWGRARAFGKLAATLIELANPSKGGAGDLPPEGR